MNSNSDDREDDALRARLDKLSGALKERAQSKTSRSAPSPDGKPRDGGMGSAMSLGLQAGSEFVCAVVLGAAIGWGADRLLHTSPAFLIVFFLLGVAAGIWNVIRLTSPPGGPPLRNSPLSRADPPDKDGRRSAPWAGHAASQGGREASGEAARPPVGTDDDED